MENNPDKKESKKKPYYTGIGIALGAAFGVVIDNLAIGISVGLVIGVSLDRRKKKED